MKKLLKISAVVLLVTGIAALLGFVSSQPRNVLCSDIRVKIDYDSDRFFITEDQITEIIRQNCDTISNTFDEQMRLKKLEELVMQQPAVKSCEVYASVNGKMTVEVEQRRPIGRIINGAGDAFYMDEDGKLMPLIDDRPARVVIVNGNIRESYSPSPYYLENDSAAKISVLDNLFEVLLFIHNSKFWSAQIEQIYVDEKQEFILIPKVGMHEIIFGGSDNLKGKFNKLELFYNKGMTKEGWKRYKTINVKYKGQVICKGDGPILPPVLNDSLTTNSVVVH